MSLLVKQLDGGEGFFEVRCIGPKRQKHETNKFSMNFPKQIEEKTSSRLGNYLPSYLSLLECMYRS